MIFYRVTMISLMLFLIIGCATTEPVQNTKPVSHGERLFRSNCQSCHRLPNPLSHPPEDWSRLVHHMGPRAHLPDSSMAEIVQYLEVAAKKN